MSFARIGELNLHYLAIGAGPVVLFLPGFSLDGGVWRTVALRLASTCTSVLVDNRGAGLSDAPKQRYTIEVLAADIDELTRLLDIKEALLVGHSMGGFVGIELALNHKPWLKHLLLVSTSATGRPDQLGSSPRAVKALAQKRGSLREILREIAEVGIGRQARERVPEIIEQFVEERQKHPSRGTGISGQSAASAGFDRTGQLHAITVPCTVIHGTDDEIISCERAGELASEIAGSRLVLLEGVGHFPPIEAVDALVREIERAL